MWCRAAFKAGGKREGKNSTHTYTHPREGGKNHLAFKMDIAEGIKVSVKILACHGYLKSTTRGESQSKSEKDGWYH